jgi:hypothetical protein
MESATIFPPNHFAPVEQEGDNPENKIREKILRVLSRYPKVSPSMLQTALGTSLPPAIWKPIMGKMQGEGLIRIHNGHDTGSGGRAETFTVIELAQ